ncbi:MAG: hypothetical protein EG826_09900 [Deltaproteobacteria bacterium]|nr:hypothetical protein [Deltaproteobacteria bacterium]
MALDEQIAEMIRAGSAEPVILARYGSVAAAAGSAVAGVLTGNPVFYGIAFIFVVIGCVIWRVTPHIHNAARGLKEGLKRDGAVEIRMDRWTDAESNRFESYQGIVSMDNRPLWHMDFATPQDWQPIAGRYSVQLAFIPGIAWPVAIITNDGVLYPRLKPRPASSVITGPYN